ncbi:EI24 domain-containing protein [Sulfitobacter sp. D35]|uniref:EI24 domain-containing protein n=1 Tax=Sulfitobacter sp. D35 TaxID=3083252 RepID=UPI00296E8433|nr:EI24 domain-containing protein [Sulfitobacter sp. D35]MDW4498995.1 EI24 domain-containing protein [Sulfitobacter sp. D35]
MIAKAILTALGQIGDPRFRRVLLTGVGLTLLLLIAATAGFAWLFGYLVGNDVWLPYFGEVQWVDNVVSWGSVLLMMVLSVFLMVPVASAITSMFLDTVADAVEEKHYPALPPANDVPFGDAVRDTVNFLGVLIAANLFALVLYLIFAPFAPLIFWGLNGFLLGREYFTLAAIRRVGRAEAKVLRRRYLVTIWAAGVLMAMPLSIPLLNLVVPIIGAATFTHLFHLLTEQASSGPTSRDRAR